MKKYAMYFTQLLFLIYIIMFNNVIVKYFLNYLNIINILFFGLLLLIVYLFFGYPKNKKIYNYSAIQSMIIGFIIYYTGIYVLGLFFGFSSNVYSLKFINIFKNIIFAIGYYSVREMYRYITIKQSNNRNSVSFILITILFILLDIIMEVNSYDLTNSLGIFEFVCSSVIPNVAINLLLSYMSGKFNIKVLLLFIMVLKLPNYFLPIFPNLGDYLNSVLLIILIFYLYYEFSLILEKYDRKISFKRQNNRKSSLLFVLVPTIIFVGLVSGLFKYHLFAIVSNSMVPVFSRGDAVLIEKIASDELEKLKVGDIIAFYDTSNRMIVHRIVEINIEKEQYFIKTKGDNNESVDTWNVSNKNIYGRVITHIKYIGIPSVEISELLNR